MSDITTATIANPSDRENYLVTIIVPVVLGSIIVILLVAFMISACLFLKKRRKLCFKGRPRYDDVKPFLLKDQKFQSGATKQGWKRNIKPDKKKKQRGKKVKYQSLGRIPRFPKRDPFARAFLENPLADDDALNEDWTNPLFDTKQAALRDAAITIQSWFRMIRVRLPYLELREAVILCQSLYRGYRVRKIVPQLKREKQIKDQQRKKQAGWKKKGTLSALKFFEVKGFGFAEVEQLYGLETVRNAAEQLKSLYGGKGKMKLKLFISVKGLKLYDYQTFSQFAAVKISSVSFCTLDPKNKKIFAFINRKKKRNFCHVFQANEHDAQKMVETMAEAFEVTFKRLEERRESREMARLAAIKKRAFHRQSQELDVEVASMMEMAETASVSTTPSLDRRSITSSTGDHRRHSGGSSDGSITGSRERLIPSGQSRHSRGSNRSSLTVSQKAPQPNSVSSGLGNSLIESQPGGETGMNSLARERRNVNMDIEKHHLNNSIDRMVHRFT